MKSKAYIQWISRLKKDGAKYYDPNRKRWNFKMHLTERKGPLNRLRKRKYKKIFQGQSATLEMAPTFYNINLC